MGQVINTNVASLNAQRQLNKSQQSQMTAMQRLSSGIRINSAKDDAGGQAISERMTSQIRGLNQATRNANDGVSLSQTAEGGLAEVGNLLQRLRELAVQSSNDTNTLSDRQAIDGESRELIAEINNIAQTTQFNGKGVINGDSLNLDFQVGAYTGQQIRLSRVDARASYLGGNMVRGHAMYLDTTTGQKGYQLNDFTSINLNGVTIQLDSTGAKATTIDGVIAAVNRVTESTGISALRSSRTVIEADEFAGGALVENDVFSLNGVRIQMTARVPGALTQDDVLTSINSLADKTGVRAEISDIYAPTDIGQIKLVSNGDIVINTDTSDPNFAAPGGLQAGTYYRGMNFISNRLEGDTGGLDSANITLVMGAAGGTQAADAGRMTAIQAAAGTVTDDSNLELVRDYSVQTINMSSKQGSELAIDTLDFAINQVNTMRGKLGAMQNRFETAMGNLQSQSENITAARSRIRDADFAQETGELSRNQILQQAGTAMLAQANAATQNVLSLLR
jgi:flagellin